MISAKEVKVSKYKTPSECTEFQNEKPSYAKFIKDKNEAMKLQTENVCVTYLFKFIADGRIAGYVGLAMGTLLREELPSEFGRIHRFKKFPCLLLGQMARDSRFAGKGIGKIMVDWVILKAVELSREVGCRFVILDAEQDRKTHYEKFLGFKPIPQRKKADTTLMYINLGLRRR